MADNLFNPDPYYQQGGDMVRVGGLSYTVNVDAPMGQRIEALKLTRTGTALAPDQTVIVAGWGSISESTKGPPVWELISEHLSHNAVIRPERRETVKVVRSN